MQSMPDPAKSTTATNARNVYVFGATSLLNDTASEMAYWVLPAFLKTLGAGPMQLGIIEGVAESLASFAKLFSGYLADRVPRRKPMVVAGYAVANIAKPFLAVATAWWQVLGIRVADRLAKGVRGAPRDVMLAESVAKERHGSAFGLLQAMDTAGAIVGPLLAVWLLMRHDLRTVFWWAAVPGLLSIAIVALLARETRVPSAQPAVTPPSSALDKPSGRATWRSLGGQFYYLMFAIGLFSLGNSSDMFLVLRAQDVGITAAQAPLLGLVFNLVYTTTSWPAGKLSDKVSKPLLAALGYLVFAAVYFVFAQAPSKTAIWVMMAFYGLFYSLTNPVLRALIANTIAPELRGRAFGLFYFVTSVTALLASLITGELWTRFGAALPFYLSSGLAAAAAVMLMMAPLLFRSARVMGR
ncbi:MAG: MFS transporter [Acidobacteriales bacterium]|nr:MFS transporter [Terriglobales bacterium]